MRHALDGREERREVFDHRFGVGLSTGEVAQMVRDVGERHLFMAAGLAQPIELTHRHQKIGS